ncbi:hypothetical protein AQUCO_01200110v1 [Aquilegia coerulea]|uniref:Knottin scorpion toxin-like domain-containing protein n=1 Tax=Aquilegia coerulea TaxID=218851 RepID=A0A2G5E4L4_AQUCA|nr:hypothetical protein AQUCO_01200110v1 [Aquilegia coerulea]
MEKIAMFTRRFLLSLLLICLLVTAPISADVRPNTNDVCIDASCSSAEQCNKNCQAQKFTSGSCNVNKGLCYCHKA